MVLTAAPFVLAALVVNLYPYSRTRPPTPYALWAAAVVVVLPPSVHLQLINRPRLSARIFHDASVCSVCEWGCRNRCTKVVTSDNSHQRR